VVHGVGIQLGIEWQARQDVPTHFAIVFGDEAA
jgi:hypothetical protein